MKSHELVERINNGEIKDGTKIKRYGYGKDTMLYLCGKILRYKETDVIVSCDVLLDNEVEFEIVEEHKGWFKPKNGEWYWCINSCGVLNRDNWDGGKIDLHRYNNHNCFRNVEEAQEYLDYKNALKEAEKPFEIKRDNYFIRLNSDGDNLFLDRHFLCQYQGITYLGQDEEVAQAFIEKWEKQILKYEFDVWE